MFSWDNCGRDCVVVFALSAAELKEDDNSGGERSWSEAEGVSRGAVVSEPKLSASFFCDLKFLKTNVVFVVCLGGRGTWNGLGSQDCNQSGAREGFGL